MSQKTTEQPSHYDHLEKMSTQQLLTHINQEDQTVPQAVARVIPQIEKLVDRVYEQMREGGRLFYLGSGTSGRLGIVDASECPPTYGVPHDWVIGLIAGGKGAILKAVEYAEDSLEAGWKIFSPIVPTRAISYWGFLPAAPLLMCWALCERLVNTAYRQGALPVTLTHLSLNTPITP
jgi:N-acetylmuramic acid 6-phosphate (MurNAc-6-P) etherase